MIMFLPRQIFATALLASLSLIAGGAARAETPIRVFVLTGQSNMQGKGKIAHLEKLATAPETAEKYGHFYKDGEWIERDDVMIKYWDQKGPLTVGFASPTDRFGPELGFGRIVGDSLEVPVLIIKVAWGGQSLGCLLYTSFICEYLIEGHGAEYHIEGKQVLLRLQVQPSHGEWRQFDPYAAAVGLVQDRKSLREFLEVLCR